jgi:sarcosine oxidase, subunit alpha
VRGGPDGRADYVLVDPQVMLVAAGAREKSLTFKGNTLAGVYGAGAFQTLVNRDLVRPSERLFIVGGGNVGLIAGYHALQAGIQVVGLVEALPQCGGYKVHEDKLVRMGVPIYTSHTVLSANGGGENGDTVESVTIAKIDQNWQPIPGSERSFACDTLLIAVGLDPVNEFYHKALEFGLTAFAAGDADEVAEASAAMFSGKIRGLQIARQLGRESGDIPEDWFRTAELLKSKPGQISHETVPQAGEVYPVLHCSQEIPCNPCTSVCSQGAIFIDENDIRQVPQYIAEKLGTTCIACEKCVTVCPGLAITLVDLRVDGDTGFGDHPLRVRPGSHSCRRLGGCDKYRWRRGGSGGGCARAQRQSHRPHRAGQGTRPAPDRQPDRRHSSAGAPGGRAARPLCKPADR